MFTRVLILLIKEWKAVCLPLSITLMLVDSNVKQNRIDSNQQSIFQFLWKWAEGLRGQRHFNNKTAPSWRWTHKVRKLHTHCVYRCVCLCVYSHHVPLSVGSRSSGCSVLASVMVNATPFRSATPTSMSSSIPISSPDTQTHLKCVSTACVTLK